MTRRTASLSNLGAAALSGPVRFGPDVQEPLVALRHGRCNAGCLRPFEAECVIRVKAEQESPGGHRGSCAATSSQSLADRDGLKVMTDERFWQHCGVDVRSL